MIEEKNTIIDNNNMINELKDIIKKRYKKEIEIYPNNSDDNYQETIAKQNKDISKLKMIIDAEEQAIESTYHKKIEELQKNEKDLEFSNFYRKGIIEINNIEVSIDKFYIKELSNNNKTFYNFICTDKRIDKRVFGTIEDKQYEVLNIYKLKDSNIFYSMYLDKNLYSNNKIVLNDINKIKLFMNYIHSWNKENHNMVAETMIKRGE